MASLYPAVKALIVLAVIHLIFTSVFLFLTAGKDPATIPMRDFMKLAYNKKIDKSDNGEHIR